MAKKIYDITPVVSPRLSVWPGDTGISREVLLDTEKGDNITLSTIRATVHLGAHVDAPNHYGKGVEGMGTRSLEYYLGTCQVIKVEINRGERIYPDRLKTEITELRVLFSTGTYPDPENFNEDFAALSAELINYLHEKNVLLVGIDTPSIDTFDSKDLPSHKAVLKNNMAILEGIVLTGVPDGAYELIALPLKLEDFDASPVRAILREI
jgi:arylformamidase